jgi:type I restriction enzyme S subunit
MLSPKSRGGIRPLPYLRNANVQWDRFDLADVSQMDFDEREERKFQLRPGDLLVCEGGEPGRAAVWNGEITRCCYQKALHRIRPIGDSVDPHFLKYRLWLAASMGEFLDSNAKTTIAHLPAIRLAKLRVALPEIAEQRRIAARLREQLTAVAQARAAVQAQLDAAQALPAAHLRVIFNGDVAKKWPMSKLGELAEVSGGIQKTPDRAPRQFHKQFLTVRNVQRGYLDLTRVERFEVTPAEFARCRLERGDILIVEGNGSVDHIGRNALFDQDGEWIHQNHIIRVRLSGDHFQPEFVSLFLNSEAGRKQMLEKAKSTTGLYTLSTSKVASLEIPTAPLAAQREISARLEGEKKEAAGLTKTLTDKLTALEHLPAALLREAFKGKA